MAEQKAKAVQAKLLKGREAEEEARQFLTYGAKVPDALLLAALGNRASDTAACPRTLRVLLDGRADPGARDPMTSSPIIHTACWHGSVDAVKVLLECRADLEAKEQRMGTPPLNTALAAGSAKVCLELLDQRANVQWTHHDGATALHVATAWIASSHNASLRLPPVGEEPRQVIAKMLFNGVDPTKTEGMSKSSQRSTGMTPLESFRREIAASPWRTHEQIGQKFDQTARTIHTLLEQGEEATKHKVQGNKAFGAGRYQEALKLYGDARRVWEATGVLGHHMAVLWSNEAKCHLKMEAWDKAREACEKGLQFYAADAIPQKLAESKQEAEEKAAASAAGTLERPPAPERKPPTRMQDGFLDKETTHLYPNGSVQGHVDRPGPFICNFDEAKEAGFVDGIDGWRDRMKKEEQELDRQLVKDGLMKEELLDDPSTVDLINRIPPYNPAHN